MSEAAEDFKPRNYQVELMEIALKKNSIIFLPTGSGKTYIALMVLKQMSGSLSECYSNGGKISIILVNTVALVEQHAKYIRQHTTLNVGQFTGEMNLDFWPKDKWYKEFDKYQVLIMTCQILVNLNNQKYMDLNRVNLLVFDECHRGVNDQPMRTLMKTFGGLQYPPRVLGLTATLLNRNCKPDRVLDEILELETTYHSKIATVEGLSDVVGYSTNPTEDFKVYNSYSITYIEGIVIGILEKYKNLMDRIHQNPKPDPSISLNGLIPISMDSNYKKISRLILDIIEHINMLGSYGGVKTIMAHIVQVERIKRHCTDVNVGVMLTALLTTFQFVKALIQNSMVVKDEREQIFSYSSEKVLKLLEILKEYKERSSEELCCLVFTQRRFTAKILYHIIKSLSQCDPDYSHIKPDFMVGYNANPYNDTRESLYLAKKNKQILESFVNKEINVLLASDVLEEGVDIPKCTLVVKFDKPTNYRSYIQSKGRARHKDSLYYIMFDKNEINFMAKYKEFQIVEQTLNDYLIGKNDQRIHPSQSEIEKMYNEDELPPYYVDGPGSAQVNMVSAISLLSQYCSSLPSDVYTTYAPEWYVRKKTVDFFREVVSVVIILPVICPILDPIEGIYMSSIKLAKRAAALKACIMLHKAGELDDHLLPIRRIVDETQVEYLFRHYPAIKESEAGTNKKRRLHPKQIPQCLKGQVTPNQMCYLHIIHLEPQFNARNEDIQETTLYDCYKSSLCFGLITCNRLPVICGFPIYVKLGQINVSFRVNQKKITLTENELMELRTLHCLIFDDVLRVLQPFLIFDNSTDAEILLLAPVHKDTLSIDFNVIRNTGKINSVTEPTQEERRSLEVDLDTHLRQIVSPWYRPDSCYYVVTEVCLNKNASTPFPNEDFSSFNHYYYEKHNLAILRPELPLLFVKGLTKQLNFIKPRGSIHKKKRSRSDMYEETSEYLLPELVVKQDFPSALWIQASFLPTILSRITFCLQIEELRSKIAKEAGLGRPTLSKQSPLKLDIGLYSSHLDQEEEENIEEPNNIIINFNKSSISSSLSLQTKRDTKKLESQYPWKDVEEPKDIERELNVTVMDIDYYETFLCRKVDEKSYLLPNEQATKQLALTYNKVFTPKSIMMLESSCIDDGPEICDLYQALSAMKANDIVNLERLETLGDSFLKYIATVYIYLRFPHYDEGRATSLKGRLVSNKNLFYLANKKNIGGIMQFHALSPREEWLPPCFIIPKLMKDRIDKKDLSVNALFDLRIPVDEQISGVIVQDTIDSILQEDCPLDEDEEDPYASMAQFLKCHYISDKNIADVVESLLGTYFKTCGMKGALKFVEWINIIPQSENLEKLLCEPSPSALINKNGVGHIDMLIPYWKKIEATLDYHFKDRSYLLQALSHSSYTQNRLTLSYEKLEFLGDAILDFLITCHIYESCGQLDPGQLTDLRAALVNNVTFASLAVRCDFHKYFLMINSQLQAHIDRFVSVLEQKNFEIDDHILTLLEEGELVLAEQVDVPKVLGDIFESIAGAIYLDSGKNLNEVWRVFYKIMWKEIDSFSQNVPKNAVRKLFEWPGAYPKFGNSATAANNKTIIPLEFMKNGIPQIVHGCGSNKVMAKKAAAKLALQSLEV